VIVQSASAFAAYMKKAANPPKPQGGKGLFTSGTLGCSSCHVLTAAGSSGTLGPDLDYLAAYAKRAGKPVDAFARESILDPAAYIEPGCTDAMPHNFKDLLKQDQLDELVDFLVKSGTKTQAHKGCGS
jgi:mono/diheme cytochrome c family protein